MTINPGNKIIFSIRPPVVILNARTGRIPNLTGMGKSQGTPSLLNVSMTRCDKNPIINAHQITSIFNLGKLGVRISSNILHSTPNTMTPSSECEKNLWPPSILPKNFPNMLPIGRFLQKGAVGWSMSGAIPPIMFDTNATSAVARVIFGRGLDITTTPNAVNAARSWVLPVIINNVLQS